MDLSGLRQIVRESLGGHRLNHVLSCEREAEKLAVYWGADPYKAKLAALLHDITKELSKDEQLKLCEKNSIMLDGVEKAEWKLLHAVTAAAVAKTVYHAPDDVCDAIRYHTTGKENMTLLQKVVYLADFIEPTRDFPGVSKLRELAYQNIDEALIFAFDSSILEVIKRGGILHPDTVNGRNWICAERRDKK